MKRPYRCTTRLRKGSILILVAFLLPVLVLLAAFAVNIAYMQLNRTEMYIATDAATRAGGRELATTGSQVNAKIKARDAAMRNTVGGKPLRLRDSDFTFGVSTRTSLAQKYTFTPGGTNPNALSIIAHRDSLSLDGAINLLMPNVLTTNRFSVSQESRSTQIELDIAIVIDRSGSMAYSAAEPAVYPPSPSHAPVGWTFGWPVPPQSRWGDAVGAVNVFLQELTNSPTSEQVSLVTYNHVAGTDIPLTSNYSAVAASLNYYTLNFGAGATNIAGGINEGVNSLASTNSRPWASKVIVILTDGIQTVPGDIDGAAWNAANQGVMVFTVTFSNEANQWVMQNVASIGMGRHYHATTGSDLATVFHDIAKSLPTILTK